jgi:hypothetical protein
MSDTIVVDLVEPDPIDVIFPQVGVPGVGVPMGGAADQALIKVDGDDYNTEWADVANSVNGQTGAVVLDAADVGAEPAFVKGDLIAGTNVTLDGDLTDRLVGTGDVTINVTGGDSAVDSVNGQTGAVVLDTDDIADTAANRFTDDTAIARLANTSGANTGDQNLTPYFNKSVDDMDDITDGTTYKKYSATEKTKLAGIQAGAEVNVNADWNSASGDSEILNKPSIPSIANLFNKTTDDADDITEGTTNKFISATQKTDLTDGGDTSLHFHAADRARANHTGTQTASTISDFSSAADVRIAAQKGVPNGLAELDGSGKINSAELPPLAITEAFAVASQAAMLALVAQQGDIAIRSDINKTFILSTNSPTVLADWLELKTPTDAVLSFNGRTGAISPTSGDYTAAQTTNTPAGTISATDVQGALNELDTEKVPTSRTVNGQALTANVTLTKSDVGLGNVDNTSDANKPVSTATQTALNLKANIASPTFTGTVTIPTGASITAPTGIVKADVGLGNVDNTSDANKPVSTATQTALNLKANIASPTFTGTVTIPTGASITAPTGIVKADVGLGNVDNTSDATKNAAASTLTNKRIQPRVSVAASASTLTPEKDTFDAFSLTALAANLTIANHSTSTPTNFEKIQIRIVDNGMPRTLTFGTNYIARGGLALPTTTVANKMMTLGFEWVTSLLKYNLIALSQET